eukprot:2563057-Prymnesium_polylepis.1
MTLAVYIHFGSYLAIAFGGGRCGGLGIQWDEAVAEAQRRLEEPGPGTARSSSSNVEPLRAVPVAPMSDEGASTEGII